MRNIKILLLTENEERVDDLAYQISHSYKTVIRVFQNNLPFIADDIRSADLILFDTTGSDRRHNNCSQIYLLKGIAKNSSVLAINVKNDDVKKIACGLGASKCSKDTDSIETVVKTIEQILKSEQDRKEKEKNIEAAFTGAAIVMYGKHFRLSCIASDIVGVLVARSDEYLSLTSICDSIPREISVPSAANCIRRLTASFPNLITREEGLGSNPNMYKISGVVFKQQKLGL